MTSSIASLLMVLVLWLSMAIFCCAGGAFEKPLSAGERAEALRGKETGCNTMEKLKSAGAFTKVEAGYSGVTHAYQYVLFRRSQTHTDRGFAIWNVSVEIKPGKNSLH
jgi:hypothetical protein